MLHGVAWHMSKRHMMAGTWHGSCGTQEPSPEGQLVGGFTIQSGWQIPNGGSRTWVFM